MVFINTEGSLYFYDQYVQMTYSVNFSELIINGTYIKDAFKNFEEKCEDRVFSNYRNITGCDNLIEPIRSTQSDIDKNIQFIM